MRLYLQTLFKIESFIRNDEIYLFEVNLIKLK